METLEKGVKDVQGLTIKTLKLNTDVFWCLY